MARDLRHYLAGEATSAIPVWRMIALPLDALTVRAEVWRAALTDLGLTNATLRPDRSAVGGGSLPGETLPTVVLAVPLEGVLGGEAAALRRLRLGHPPLIARAADGHLLADPRTVFPAEGFVRNTLSALRSPWRSVFGRDERMSYIRSWMPAHFGPVSSLPNSSASA